VLLIYRTPILLNESGVQYILADTKYTEDKNSLNVITGFDVDGFLLAH
jgi:hypothetical protein